MDSNTTDIFKRIAFAIFSLWVSFMLYGTLKVTVPFYFSLTEWQVKYIVPIFSLIISLILLVALFIKGVFYKRALAIKEKKKFNWKLFAITIIGIFLFNMVTKQQQEQRLNSQIASEQAEYEERKAEMPQPVQATISSFNVKPIHLNIDSSLKIINKNKKSNNISLAAFNPDDSCIIIYIDNKIRIDTSELIYNFGKFYYDEKFDIASNIAGMIVGKMPTDSELKATTYTPQLFYINAKPGSRLYNSYDSMGAFKH